MPIQFSTIAIRFVCLLFVVTLCTSVRAASFGQASDNLSAGAGLNFVAGDFNGDGHLDLAVTRRDDTIGILLGLGTGTFTDAVSVPGMPQLREIAAGDLDGDGDLDLVVSSFEQGIGVLFGNGNGTFQSMVAYPRSAGDESL